MSTRNIAWIALFLLLSGCANQTMPADHFLLRSGLQNGEDVVPWNPIHVAGPNKNTNACPICTYEARPAVQIFMKDGPAVPAFASHLESLVNQQRKRDFQGLIIVVDGAPQKLQQLADSLNLSRIGLCYPDPQTQAADLAHYKINPAASNTIMVYKDYKIIANFVNLDAADLVKVDAVLDHLP